jgi:hypothetical protein
MVDDEKLRLLAFEDRWHFVALLCLKGQGVLDETGSLLFRKVAVKLGLDVRSVEEVARRLSEVGLIDEKTLQPIAWEARQFRSDSSAARVAAYRERKKQGVKRDGNVTVTAQDTDTDTDTDKEEEKKEEAPSPKSPRGTALPKDWELPGDWRTWAEGARPDVDVLSVADSFRDYWVAKPGKDGRKSDWLATWRNWVRNQRSGNSGQRPQSAATVGMFV